MLNNNLQQWPFVRGCPLPEDLANVLIAVGKVASGQLKSISISGCAAVGWIAAAAQWLFDLKVVVTSSLDDSDPVYTNCAEGQDAQIYLAFDPGSEASASRSRLHIVQKSYLLNDSSSLMVMVHDGATAEKILYSGRVPWKTCLVDTFGSDFERLKKAILNFGSAIGCAARIFKAIAKAETGVPEKYLKNCRGYFTASGGQGFVSNALLWFPELDAVKSAMHQACRLSFEQAKSTYEEKFWSIQRLCDCGVCRDFDNYGEGEGFCLVVILETILALCQITSGLMVVEHLYPMRSGLEAFYKRQLFSHQKDPEYSDDDDGELEEGLQHLGPIIYVLWSNGFVDLTDEAQALEGRLLAAIKLFTGRDTPTNLTASAVSESGIVAYLDILCDFSISSESTGRVHVMPGAIEYNNKKYSQVQDNEMTLMRNTVSVTELSANIAEINEVAVEVTETAHSLLVSYLLRHRSDSNMYLRIGPGDIVDCAHKARGLVHCDTLNRSCKRRRQSTVSCDKTGYPLLNLNYNGDSIAIVDTTKGGECLRAVALRIGTSKNSLHYCILSDGECIDCCLAKVSHSNERPALVIANLSGIEVENLK